MNLRTDNTPCPCGSGKPYAECCDPVHDGKPAQTAEALMRSRYSAYVLKKIPYLLHSWHSRTRPNNLDLSDDVQWCGLEIVRTEKGGATDEQGVVEFIARYQSGDGEGQMREVSRFRREQGRWVYLDADPNAHSAKPEIPGRNAPCPCGSGKKYKRCCGA